VSATLSGRSVVVTNAATDVGRAVCAGLGRAGAQVTAQADGRRVGSAQLVADAVAAFGCLDGFVNCHNLTPQMCGSAESLTLDAFMAGISRNLSEPFFGCQAAAAQMLDQVCPHATPNHRGNIVNITSVAAVLALPGHATFCSAMAGLDVDQDPRRRMGTARHPCHGRRRRSVYRRTGRCAAGWHVCAARAGTSGRYSRAGCRSSVLPAP